MHFSDDHALLQQSWPTWGELARHVQQASHVEQQVQVLVLLCHLISCGLQKFVICMRASGWLAVHKSTAPGLSHPGFSCMSRACGLALDELTVVARGRYRNRSCNKCKAWSFGQQAMRMPAEYHDSDRCNVNRP